MKSIRNRPKKPDIIYKDKKYWLKGISRYEHYSSEYDDPINCDSYDIAYWDTKEDLTGDEDIWEDWDFCELLKQKCERLF